MRRLEIVAFFLPLLGGCPASAQVIKLPPKVEVATGRLAAVTIEHDGDDLKWTTPEELDVFREYDPDPKKIRLRLIGYTAGTYHVHAVTCKAGKLSEFATCQVIVGKPGPKPPPGPDPPDPKPPDPPDPPPIPAKGLRVLIVEESADRGKMTQAQANILFSKTIRDWLNSNCAMGPDGKTREWRIYDKDVDLTSEAKTWQDAIKRSRTGLPWIVISNGERGYEGPLPKDVPATLELLKKYAAPAVKPTTGEGFIGRTFATERRVAA